MNLGGLRQMHRNVVRVALIKKQGECITNSFANSNGAVKLLLLFGKKADPLMKPSLTIS
jgi:hypothetical protein